jgi:hypothetical protein
MHFISPRHRTLLKIASLCLLPFLSCACATLRGDKNDAENLLACVEVFNSNLKWQDYKEASVFLPPAMQESFWKETDDLQGKVRMMDYQIRNIAMEKDGQAATVLLRYRFFYTNDPYVQTKMVRQQWRYLEPEKAWQIVNYDLQCMMPEKP